MITSTPPSDARRILIFLLGSLGDTVVAIPALRLIQRRFPNAERRVLTHFAISDKAAPMDALLANTGLVQGYIRFSATARDPASLVRLAREIRQWKPDLLVHLHEPRGRINAWRDALFFAACGIRHQVGIPLGEDLQNPRYFTELSRYEHRAEYLQRKLQRLGDTQLDSRASWDLALTAAERARATEVLAPLAGCKGILAMSIGTKVSTNDWGDANWRSLLGSASRRLPGWGLVALGARVEHDRTGQLLSAWNGPGLNLCGSLSVRESAAVLHASRLYVGHDSGPLHLASAVGTHCIGIYSARNLPGIWFPYGSGHCVFYHQTPCYGCGLSECVAFSKQCILSIEPAGVAESLIERAQASSAASPTR